MAFSDFNAAVKPKGISGSKLRTDISTPEGLTQFARQQGISVEPQKPSIFARGVSTTFDVLQASAKLVGGLIKGDENVLPSDAIFGKAKEHETLGESLKYQFTTGDGLKRLATDILLDPLTYVTLGTSAALKVITIAGARVAVNKVGRELVTELAEELVTKGAGRMTRETALKQAKQQAAKLVAPEGKNILERGGLANIKLALEKTGQKMTAQNVKKIIQEGAQGLIEKPSLKFAGQKILELPKGSELVSKLAQSLKAIPAMRPLVDVIENTAKNVGKLFSRDIGLPEAFKPMKQRFIDSYDNAVGRIKNDLTVVFAGTTKEQRIVLTKAIESGAIHTLPENLKVLAKRTKDIFASIAKEEERRGILNRTLDDYVTHIYRNKEKAKLMANSVRDGQPSALLRFNKTRTLPNLEEAKALGLDPIEDIAEILNVRLISSERAKLTQDFVKNVSTKFGKDVPKTLRSQLFNNGESLVRFSDAVTGVPKEFKNTFIPANIAEDIASMNKRFFSDESAVALLRGYDKLLHFFTGSVTVSFPSFHIRNGISNVLQNFLDISVQAFNPVVHKAAVDVLTGAEGNLVNKFGEEISYSAIRKAMKENQIVQDTLARTDIGRSLETNVLKKMTPFEVGRRVGRAIENEARLVNFIGNLKRGLDIEDAAARTKQFLFDYDNLSVFEKDVMRRAIPFYTWTRKNIALQLRELVKQPGKQAAIAKMFETLNTMFGKEQTDEEKQFTPDFIAQGLNILLKRSNDDRTFLVGFDLPLESAIEQVSGLLSNPFKTIMNQMSPYIKAPVEIATGRNIFLEKDIEEDDSGNFAENLPQPIKDWMGFTSKDVTTKEGKDFTIMKVDPKKKFIWRNVTAMGGVGRFTSAAVLNGVTALYKLFTGDKVDTQDKADILRLFSGISAQTTSLEAQKKAVTKKMAEDAEAKLERKGVEVGTFERKFIPKAGSKLKSKLK